MSFLSVLKFLELHCQHNESVQEWSWPLGLQGHLPHLGLQGLRFKTPQDLGSFWFLVTEGKWEKAWMQGCLTASGSQGWNAWLRPCVIRMTVFLYFCFYLSIQWESRKVMNDGYDGEKEEMLNWRKITSKNYSFIFFCLFFFFGKSLLIRGWGMEIADNEINMTAPNFICCL